MTQEALASAVGVSRSLVSSWENGKAVPNEENLERLCSFFHTPLFSETEKEETVRLVHHENAFLISIYHCLVLVILFLLELHMRPFGLVCALTGYLYARQGKLPLLVRIFLLCLILYECVTLFFFFYPSIPQGWTELPSHRVHP